MILGIIPARGGSQRLPRKALAVCAGRTLLAWAIESALASKALTGVWVTTDDGEILESAQAYAVTVIRRPPHLAMDSTPDLPVFQHVLGAIEDHQPPLGFDDLFVHLRPTNPLRTGSDIDAAVDYFRARWASSLRSVVRARQHPGKMYDQGGMRTEPWAGFTELRPLIPPMHEPNGPSQWLPPVWAACGFVDIVRAPFVRMGSMEGPSVAAWPIADRVAVDIDTAEDVAEVERRMGAGTDRRGGGL